MITLSHVQASDILWAMKHDEQSCETSADLNLSKVQVRLSGQGATFPSGDIVTPEQLNRIKGDENKCFTLHDGELEEIRFFSEETRWVRSLYPTKNAPTMLVSGMLMHRVKGIDPYKDTLKKIKAARPIGRVLDTATGLGYTAIEAAKQAEHVVTVELDPAGLEIARLNPWSAGLFDNPKITQVVGDAFDVVEDAGDETFSVIIHDPPTFNLAGDLYSADFYRELHRILRSKGRVFHYIGDPKSKFGSSVTRGVLRRLAEVGFRRVDKRPEAFGVLAHK